MIADVITLMTKNSKRCRGCAQEKLKSEFVSRFGYKNPKGWLCRHCWDKRQKDEVQSMMDGRDSCLYCGEVITRSRDYDENGEITATYVHMDHMDPVSLGGYDPFTYDLEIEGFTEDTTRNMVCCCAKCNLKKKDRPFTEWLKLIPAENRELARSVYIEKNGFSPEEFAPVTDDAISFTISFDDTPDSTA